ncbi:hypothetical protein PPERSA_01683 [Pseudocohnilembus persalinus]|uniref:Sperm-tail PG-rich repeat n=1 Tax=Pseudocohnilembus persalinus TaxID=266149 RepID=A0A0V0R1F8_PSEPJ|nr:hypothetical protein PPERSA_01683 [Pseudocohnilembus persalinus]|eukprot:KRX08138.1 hypothetical protein PPERSA_01683 [Pseudocohnilembus persalinus]
MVSAWSIGNAKRSNMAQSIGPGPGQYTVDKQQKTQPPKWSIPKYQPTIHNQQNPGPGQYNLRNDKKIDGAKYTMSSKAGPTNQQLKVPGPGTYNPRPSSALQNPPQYTMASKYDNTDYYNNKNTGPGQYKIPSGLNKNGVKIGTSGRDSKMGQKSAEPGPGSYLINRPSTAPKVKIGSSQRQELYKGSAEGVGPGSYDLKSYFDKSKGVTMISRRNQGDMLEASRVPGPGHYNPDKQSKLNPPKHKIGTGSRGDINPSASGNPGPGQYYNDAYSISKYSRGPSAKIGTDKRRPLNENYGTPGPGQYNYNKATDGPKFSIKGATQVDPITREKMFTPGPGQYNDQALYSRQRPGSAKIGTSLRQGLYGKSATPGPGNYKFYDKNLKKGPSYGFGTSKRPETAKRDEPGPGNYNLKSTIGDIPKYAQYQIRKDESFGSKFGKSYQKY